ncbi:MAG: hypothetical protein ACRYFK_07415 [Janthinobacterium lividum]
MGKKHHPQPLPAEAGQAPTEQPQPAAPPLAAPVFLDDMALYELLARYGLQPLAPVSKFEYQLACVAAGLEQRIRELQ